VRNAKKKREKERERERERENERMNKQCLERKKEREIVRIFLEHIKMTISTVLYILYTFTHPSHFTFMIP